MIKSSETTLPGVLLIEPKAFPDSRGQFMELYHADKYREIGVDCVFVQDNLSFSKRGVVRGIHHQFPSTQAKLISVLWGVIFDVAVDIRVGSPTFARWHAETLSSDNHRQLFIPEGFAHGFCVLSEGALVSYKCSAVYDPTGDSAIAFDDPDIGVDWPKIDLILSDKDRAAKRLAEIPKDHLPTLPQRGNLI
jgi:dTDP-4-dehydrorhamnose 3,5-epimerase